jgi:tetratricopeptide (TPR) repeat protein
VALTERRVSEAEESAVRDHAATCPTCAQQLAVAIAKRAQVADAPTRELSQGELDRVKDAAKAQPLLERGTTIGHFVVLDVLGVGGMGSVYSAYDPQLERKVALKLLSTGGGPEATGPAHARMLREAQAMARLSHPNVVNVFEVGEHHGNIFIAMEYVPGSTLKGWLKAQERSWRDIVPLFVQAGRGLAAAHAAHLIHRDFKPANVLLGEDGRVRVTDFGVARADGTVEPVSHGVHAAVDDSKASMAEPLTQDDVVIGTVGYMSPEQALATTPDARSDQFGFCVSLWEALYGQRPFTGANAAEVTKAVVRAELPPRTKASVPSWLHAVLVRGLARKPEDRFPSMEALLAALDVRPLEWTKVVPWAAGLVLVGGLATWQAFAPARLRQVCDETADVGQVWSDATREQVRGAFQAINRPFAIAALSSVERGLDAYAMTLSQKHLEACEAALVRKETSEELYQLQSGCFARRRAELAELVKNLSTAEEATVERAGTSVWSLTPTALCTNTARLRADPRLSTPALEVPRLRALQTTLIEARAALDSGKLKGLDGLVAQAVVDAKNVGLAALEAEASSLWGALLQAQGKNAEAAEAWRRAAMLAHSSGFDELAALAAVRLATVIGFQLNRPAEGRTWLEFAEATIERMGGDDILTLDRIGASARLLTAENRPLEAIPAHEAALAAAARTIGPDHPLVWKLEFDFGSSLVAAKDNRRAVQHLEHALTLREREVSGDHPDSAMVRSMLANAYFFSGRPNESRVAFERALTTREALFGKDSPKLVVTLNNFGDTLLKSGAIDQAFMHVSRAQALAKKHFALGHPYVAATTLTLAEVTAARGQRAEATAALDALLSQQPPLPGAYLAEAGAVRSELALKGGEATAALSYAEKALAVARGLGPKTIELVAPLLAKGEALLAKRQPAEAEAAFLEAVGLCEALVPWRVTLADAQFGLARAKAERKDLAGARQLATAALATYRESEGAEQKAQRVEKTASRW